MVVDCGEAPFRDVSGAARFARRQIADVEVRSEFRIQIARVSVRSRDQCKNFVGIEVWLTSGQLVREPAHPLRLRETVRHDQA